MAPADISANLLTVRSQVEGSLVFVSSSEPVTNTELIIDAKSYLYGSFNTFTDVTGLDADSNEAAPVAAETYWTVTKAGVGLTIANVTESATIDGRYTIELSTIEDGNALVVGCNKGRGKATDVKYYFDNIDITG
jgi:hypothetical protein